MDLTILELHLPNAQFNAPYSHGDTPTDDEESPEEDVNSHSSNAKRSLMLLLVLIIISALAHHFREANGTDLSDRKNTE